MKFKTIVLLLISLIIAFLLDKRIIYFLISIKNSNFDKLMVYSTYLGNVLMVTVLLVAFIFYIKKHRKYLVPFLFTIIVASALTEVIKFLIKVPRPFLGLNLPVLITDAGYSFPSGHAMALTTGYMFLKKENMTLANLWLIFAIILLFGRVYTGIHYISDIIGGIIVGYFVSSFFLREK